VSLFVASPEIEDRNAVEVGNWARHKNTFYSESYILFYLQADHKKMEHELINFFLQLLQMTLHLTRSSGFWDTSTPRT
jgi:hypothetical protein